jgi:hypothetical protein
MAGRVGASTRYHSSDPAHKAAQVMLPTAQLSPSWLLKSSPKSRVRSFRGLLGNGYFRSGPAGLLMVGSFRCDLLLHLFDACYESCFQLRLKF